MPLDPTAEAPLYVQLADRLQQQIDAGTYTAGERLPSVRRLRDQHGVSLTTVLEACRVLEDRGLVRSRPRSGHYVERRGSPVGGPDAGTPSARPRRADASLALEVNLGIGNPQHPTLGAAVQGTELMPVTAINRLVSQAMRLHPTACHSYDAPPGSLELRRAISRRAADAGYTASPDEIVITSGAKEAVYLSVRSVTRPGDTVAIESPAYYALLEVLASLDLQVVEVASDPRDGIDVDALAQVLERRPIAAVTLMASFSNPTGACMPDAAKRRLMDLLEAHDVPLVEDDVYGDLAFDGLRPTAMKAYDRTGLVLHCASYSKSLSPGLRVGWAVPGRYQSRLELLKLVVNQATATAPQLAIASFLESGGFDRHLRRVRGRYHEQMQRTIDGVQRHLPSARHTTPRGGHVLWLQLPEGVEALELHRAAAAEGVQIAPGPMFSASRAYSDCIRLNTGFPYTEHTDRQLATLGRLVDERAAAYSPSR
jgi:DNA-binding transcriptional MocR family regulator